MAHDLPAGLTRAEARRFGMTIGLALVVLAGIAYWRHRTTASAILVSLGLAFIVAAALIPGVLPPIHRAWMKGAEALSRITTPIILGVFYFLVITPVGIVRRALGRDPLTAPRRGETVWTSRAHSSRSDLRRQF
jgi:saxitoxin biosynthesis operon SxtJ-like protein